MKTLLFLVGIALAACQARARLLEPDCGVPETHLIQEKIANGTAAEIGSSPWMAYLHTTNNHFTCAGSLVNHCLYFSFYSILFFPSGIVRVLSVSRVRLDSGALP